MSCHQLTEAEILARLTAARDAYHKLMLGVAVVEVRDQNGENVRFNQASRSSLYSYIQDLERMLCKPVGPRSSKPMGFVF